MRGIEQAIGLSSEDDLHIMYRWMLAEIQSHRGEGVERMLKALLANMLEDKKWIREAKRALTSELEHVARIGETMKRAGLRSYTDKEGRIFVADGEP